MSVMLRNIKGWWAFKSSKASPVTEGHWEQSDCVVEQLCEDFIFFLPYHSGFKGQG